MNNHSSLPLAAGGALSPPAGPGQSYKNINGNRHNNVCNCLENLPQIEKRLDVLLQY